MLVNEFKRIFSEIFGRRDEIYRNIVKLLAKESVGYEEIVKHSNFKSSGRLSEYLNNLENAGFITKDYTWSLKSEKESRFYQVRLSDNYLRFYLKYIEPKLNLIKKDRFRDISISSLSAWESILGLQFENLVLSNRNKILKLLNIYVENIIADNPYFQKKTLRQKGCQVDYLIQSKFKNLYLCEIKFSRNLIGPKVIQEIKNKINSLSITKKIAVLPVLIHVNGVCDSVLESNYFFKIIDFSELLENH